jgi:hypothetical protein
MKGNTVNKKLASIKNRVTAQIKAYAPEIITVGVSALALGTYITYIAKSNSSSNDLPRHDSDVEIVDFGENGYLVTIPETYQKMFEKLEPGVCFKTGTDHYRFEKHECTGNH